MTQSASRGSIMEGADKNFGLTTIEFQQMVDELREGSDQLFERIFFSHFSDCIAFVERKYSASYDDAYDATMDAALDFRLRLIDDKIQYGNMRYLFTKMATQFYLRNMKKFRMTDLEESDLLEPEQIDESDIIILRNSWSLLGEECKSLLSMNFYSNMKLSAIAEIKGKSAAAIRKQKERCLQKLMDIFSKQSTNN